MNTEVIWIGIKTAIFIAASYGCYYVGNPLIAKVHNLLDKKEQLYNEQMVRLADNVVSQRIEESNKLLQLEIKGLAGSITDLVKDRKQDIVSIGKIVTELKQDMSEQKGHAYKDQDASMNYEETVIKKQLSDKSEIPWSWAMYSPNIKSDNKWTTGTYPVKLHTNIAIGKNKDRSDAYVEAYMTSDVFNADKGKKFPIDIESVSWVQTHLKDKKFIYNPKLSLGVALSGDIFTTLGISFFSYGRDVDDMDWKFLNIGGGFSSNNGLIFVSPVEYNLGKHIPYINNLFISPFMGADKNSGVWGAQLQIPF